MKFFIDFEATQPENEIIAIGAAAENGATFHSLVKPQLSSISNFVSQMTNISQEDIDKAKTIDEVLVDFDLWVMQQESEIMHCRFISYGDDDKFIKHTLPVITNERAFVIAAVLMAKIENCLEETKQFFHGPIKLVHAFNYIQTSEIEQKHNPLEDAIMLQKVYEHIQTHEPLPCHPFSKGFNSIPSNPPMKIPSGTFWCEYHGISKKMPQIMTFASCDEAIDWVIERFVKGGDKEAIHRDRIAKNIMKAIRKKSKYQEYKWYRKKGE